MFDSDKGRAIAKRMVDDIVDVFRDEVDDFCLADWKVACETERAALFDGESAIDLGFDRAEYDADDLTDLFAWVYEGLNDKDERMAAFEGHFSDYLASAIEDAYLYGF
jgi:hypothetical protein